MFDWNQTPQTVSFIIPLAYKIDSKKIEATITEKYVKLNIPEMKLFKFIDLYDDVEIETSNIVVEDKQIIFYLKKKNEEKWPTLEYKTNNKEELRERRKIAEELLNQRIEAQKQIAKTTKTEIEKFVVDKSIKIDEEKRKELRQKKNIEKNEAEKELYKFISKIEETEKIADKSKAFLEDTNNEQIVDTTHYNKDYNEIFADNDLIVDNQVKGKTEEISNIKKEPPNYGIRENTNIRVNLTEKMIPHFAARESLSKEPPYPKSKRYVPEKNYLGQEIEDRNPIWIKEKGDNFFKNKDYRSAINAYNRALELDSDFHKCYLNRSTSLILLGEFELALVDLEHLIKLINNIDQKEKEDPFYSKLNLKALIKSYALYGIMNNYNKALEIIDILLTDENCLILGDKIVQTIRNDRLLITQRKISDLSKIQADKYLDDKDYDMAKKSYLEILKDNKDNEKILSNLSMISINQKNFDETVRYCTEVLQIIKKFKEKIFLNSKQFDNSLEIKVLLRRAESYVELGEMNKAQKDLELIERFEIRNKVVLEKCNLFKEKLKSAVLENYQQSANEYLKKKQFSEALEFYNKSASLIKKRDKVEQIKFYLNRCSCLLALGQFDNVSEECSRILSLLLKYKNVATINSNYELLKQLKDLEFNIYIKRAYSYTQSDKIEDAKRDYQSALNINPYDSNIKKNLMALENL